MTEPTEVSSSPEAPAAVPPPEKPVVAAAPAKPAPPPAAPAPPCPAPEEVGEWIHGADLPTLAALFDGLPVAKFDILVMQVRKEELVPQHWQVNPDHTPPDTPTLERQTIA